MSDDDFDDELDAILTKVPGKEIVSEALRNAVDSSLERIDPIPQPLHATRQNSIPSAVRHHNATGSTNRANTSLALNSSSSMPSLHTPSSLASSSGSKSKVQRDLFGNVVSSSQSGSGTSSQIIRATPQIEHPTHHEISHEDLATYIYPINYEIRDYQYNIIKKSFFNNVLVALPTGLGKTFIAATIILNYWRWFPQSKIIFMAPTKPLVAQQIKACFNIIGLKDQSAVLLDKSKRNRLEIWQSFRIFFTTPQVVENDLCNGLVDPKSISLLIIDEAHKAKGNYAYNNVAKFLNRFNNSYRILALTATPSSTVEGVKEIVENLNINKIEIRTENSIDIIKYFKNKRIDKIDIEFKDSELISQCLLYLSNAAEPFVKQANERHLLESSDPVKLVPFRILDISKKNQMNSSLGEGLKWSNHFLLKLLFFVATCFKKLKIYGFKNFKDYFLENDVKTSKSKNKMMNEFFGNSSVKELTKLLSGSNNQFSHPKIEKLIEYIGNFFKTSEFSNSKVIIFTEFRDSALEIVTAIESIKDDTMKPHIFIGQAADANSDSLDKKDTTKRSSSENAKLKGMNQKVQKQLIKDFKADKFNILVATSIGEEGLDIGEVDLIVCYDSTSSPIKNVQRLGRTGRKRDGNILMLFSDNERSKFDKAMDNYEWIQKYIMNNETELVAQSKRARILPKGCVPEIEKKFIVPEEMDVDDNDEIIKIAVNYMNKNTKKKAKAKNGEKEKSGKTKSAKQKQSKVERRFFMPDNVETGFRNVSEMLKNKSEPSPTDLPSSPDLIDIEFLSHESVDKNDENKRYNSNEASLHLEQTVPTVTSVEEFDLKKRRRDSTNSFLDSSTQVKKQVTQHADVSSNDNTNGHLPEATPDLKVSKNQLTASFEEFDDFDDFDDFDFGLKKTPVTENVEASSTEAKMHTIGASVPRKEQIDAVKTLTKENIPTMTQKQSKDQSALANHKFQPHDGFLTPEEKFQLYTNYYNPMPPEKEFYKPSKTTARALNSKTTKRFYQSMDYMSTLTLEQAKTFDKQPENTNLDSASCITYLNKLPK